MKLAPSERELLSTLASMPFLDRLEMVCITGWSRGAVYEAVTRLEDAGLVESVPHAAELIPPTRRYCSMSMDCGGLARDGNVAVDALLRDYPVSAHWRRVLLERLDAVAVIYRLASAVASVAHPVRLRLYRSGPLDATLLLPGGRTVGMVRQGHAADRTGFAKRLWRLGRGPSPAPSCSSPPTRCGCAMPGTSWPELPYRHSWPWSATRCWRAPTPRCGVSPRSTPPWTCARRWRGCYPAGSLPAEPPPSKLALPGRIAPDDATALPALLKPAEKRVMDLLADWPWILQRDLAGLMAVSETRVSRLFTPLEGLGLVARVPAAGGRPALTDRGLALLARRDRTSVGVARKRWSVEPS